MTKMHFLINGQGVFIFSNNIYKSCVLYFYNEDKTDGLKIKFTNGTVTSSWYLCEK